MSRLPFVSLAVDFLDEIGQGAKITDCVPWSFLAHKSCVDQVFRSADYVALLYGSPKMSNLNSLFAKTFIKLLCVDRIVTVIEEVLKIAFSAFHPSNVSKLTTFLKLHQF